LNSRGVEVFFAPQGQGSPANGHSIRVTQWDGVSTIGMGEMPIKGSGLRRSRLAACAFASLVYLLLFVFSASSSRCQSTAESTGEAYSRLNTWSVFGEFSNSSPHIFLGVSEHRRTVAAGGEYLRRLVLKRWFELEYLAQVRPLFLESDPVLAGFRSVATHQILQTFPDPQRVDILDHAHLVLQSQDIIVEPFYRSQWTYGGGLNPIGFKWSFLPRRKLQPVMTFAAGFVVSARDIPVDKSDSFNFTFELGFGVEYYVQPKRSVRLDYRVHHLSNAYVGFNNPGVDSNLFQLSYSFGK
jgi:hypothetical protein